MKAIVLDEPPGRACSKPPSPPSLLINPRSFGVARNGLASPAAGIAARYGAQVLEAVTGAEIDAVASRLIDEQRDPVFVLAGDGTLQALIDRLAALPADARRPRLFVLGGGRSNVIAAALGGCGGVLRKLEHALGCWRDGERLQSSHRTVLCVEQPPVAPRHGFFLAAGLLDYIIRACHRGRAGGATLQLGNAATALQVLRMAFAGLLGRDPPLDALQIIAEGREPLPRPARLLIATTLEKPHSVFDPFAARGVGPLRFTAVSASGAGLWARLPRIALGRFSARMDSGHGYLSGRCDRLRLLGLSSYTLDGEEFSADPTRPALIREGPRIAFLTL